MAARKERQPGEVAFHPLSPEELTASSPGMAGISLTQLGLQSKHANYLCGACGKATNGRVVCSVTRKSDMAVVLWCLCCCEKEEPTIITRKVDDTLTQAPIAREFHAGPDWPKELADLYEEASKTYSAGAFTAASMVCRKLLMAIACDKGDQEGKQFGPYVDYITNTILTYPAAKAAIDAIRNIGNEANHHVQFVNQADATRAMKIVTYVLNAIYSLPVA